MVIITEESKRETMPSNRNMECLVLDSSTAREDHCLEQQKSMMKASSEQSPKCTMMTAIKPSTNEQMRAKFFNMIGIESQLPYTIPTISAQNHPCPLDSRGQTFDEITSSSCPIVVGQTTATSVPGDNKNWVHPRSTQRASCFQESLKYDRKVADGTYNTTFSKRRKTTTDNDDSTVKPEGKKKSKKSLLFNETVEVIPIPTRHEYSNRVRSRLWSNAVEIYENAARNTVEFAAEGYVCFP
jgi:hypothetical protein